MQIAASAQRLTVIGRCGRPHETHGVPTLELWAPCTAFFSGPHPNNSQKVHIGVLDLSRLECLRDPRGESPRSGLILHHPPLVPTSLSGGSIDTYQNYGTMRGLPDRWGLQPSVQSPDSIAFEIDSWDLEPPAKVSMPGDTAQHTTYGAESHSTALQGVFAAPQLMDSAAQPWPSVMQGAGGFIQPIGQNVYQQATSAELPGWSWHAHSYNEWNRPVFRPGEAGGF